MQAIKTKWYGPTNTKNAKITATSQGGTKLTMTIPELEAIYPSNHHEDFHIVVAKALCKKLDWPTRLHSGTFGSDMFHCQHMEELTV